jgi:hypothetical protein
MRLKELRSKDVAASLIEIFDRIYTHPLLRWSAFFRSALFTLIVTAFFVFEVRNSIIIRMIKSSDDSFLLAKIFAVTFVTNALLDYLSLFIVRPWLVWCGNRPAFALLSGTVLAMIVVSLGTIVRMFTLMYFFGVHMDSLHRQLVPKTTFNIEDPRYADLVRYFGFMNFSTVSALPASAVFAWLPLFALGILVIRAIVPLSWLVVKAQWALNEGDKHPLKAIGCVAAIVVFAVAAVLQKSLAA